MRIRFAHIAVPALLAATSPALADIRSDDFGFTVRDPARWNELESYRDTTALRGKVGISQDGTALRVNGLGGKGGGAAYFSTYRIDWNDGFRVRFGMQVDAFKSLSATNAAVVGLGLGFDKDSAFNLSKGYKTGLQLEVESTTAGRTVQLVFRKSSAVVAQSAKLPLDAAWHDYEVECIADPAEGTVTLAVYLDGADTPFLSIPAFEPPAGYDAKPLTAALFGITRGTPSFSATIDHFQFEGDEYTESDDARWGDVDDHHDGPAGDSSASADFASVRYGFYSVVSQFPLAFESVISAYASYGEVVFVFRESATKVRVARTSIADWSLVSTRVRNARTDEKAALKALWDGKVVPGSDAVPYILQTTPDANLVAAQIDLNPLNPTWQIRIADGMGEHTDVSVPGNGITSGDGYNSLAPMRFNSCISAAYDAFTAGQGNVLGARILNGVIEAAFPDPASPNSVKVVRVRWSDRAILGVVTRAATAQELFARNAIAAGNWAYWAPTVAWDASMAHGGAAVVSIEIADHDGTPEWRMRLHDAVGDPIDLWVPQS